MTTKPVANLSEVALRPNDEVVAALEAWLELAKAGELHGIYMVGNCAGVTRNNEAGKYSYSEMLAGLEMAKFQLMKEWDATRTEAD